MRRDKAILVLTVISALMSFYTEISRAAEEDVKFWSESSITDKKTKKAFLECKYDAEKIEHVTDENIVSSFKIDEEVRKSKVERIKAQRLTGTYSETPEAKLLEIEAENRSRLRAMENYLKNVETLSRSRLLIKSCMASKGFEL